MKGLCWIAQNENKEWQLLYRFVFRVYTEQANKWEREVIWDALMQRGNNQHQKFAPSKIYDENFSLSSFIGSNMKGISSIDLADIWFDNKLLLPLKAFPRGKTSQEVFDSPLTRDLCELSSALYAVSLEEQPLQSLVQKLNTCPSQLEQFVKASLSQELAVFAADKTQCFTNSVIPYDFLMAYY